MRPSPALQCTAMAPNGCRSQIAKKAWGVQVRGSAFFCVQGFAAGGWGLGLGYLVWGLRSRVQEQAFGVQGLSGFGV